MRGSIVDGAAIELLDVGVIDGLLDDLRDDAALVGHAHALVGALLFERHRSLAWLAPLP